MLYAEYCFKENIDIRNTDKKASEKIGKMVNALMNTSGGLIVLNCGEAYLDKERDEWLQTFKYWIPSGLYTLLSVHYKRIIKQIYLVLFVEKSPKLATFTYHARWRHAAGKDHITSDDEIKTLIQRTEEVCPQEKPRSRLKDILDNAGKELFTLDEELPVRYHESKTIEFKHYPSITVFGAREIKKKLDADLTENISAFANTDGGSLIIGVEDTRAAVKGYQVAAKQKDEEESLTQYINSKLGKCIWNGKQPDHDTYWNVSYYDVKSEKQNNRKVIEISVHKVRGGMFYKAPVYFIVDTDTKETRRFVEVSDFDQWRRCLCGDLKTAKPKKKMDRLERHVNTNNDSGETENATREREEGTSANISEISDAENTGGFSKDTQTHRSFRESRSEYKTDIEAKSLSVYDCCINDMVKDLQSPSREHIWFPSIKSTLKGAYVPPYCTTFFAYIDQQKWEGIASVIPRPPKCHIGITKSSCDILVISRHAFPRLFCCFNNDDAPGADDLIVYALKFGRELKAQFLMSKFNAGNLPLHFHFDVQVLTLSKDGSVSTYWNSPDEQNERLLAYPDEIMANHNALYELSCTGLAEIVLQTDCSLKGYRGEVLMEHLTAEQARIILERNEKILIVHGKSGTGKTAVALAMVQEAKAAAVRADKLYQMPVLYICASTGVQAYVDSQKLCKVWKINRTDSLSDEQKSDMKTYDLVVVDDAHAIVPGENWEEDPGDLYNLLFAHSARTQAEVAIFLDPNQDFKGEIPEKFDEKLRDLALSTNSDIEKDEIQIYPLKKRIRNSREISSFIQANQNQADMSEKVPCLNERDGDDVTYTYIGTSREAIVRSVDAILDRLTLQCEKTSIVILCDDERQLEMLDELRKKLNRQIQNVTSHPITETVMCKLEDFGGLEADLCRAVFLATELGVEVCGKLKVCLLCQFWGLEFLLTWNPSENDDGRKKLEQFLELFKTVSRNLLFPGSS